MKNWQIARNCQKQASLHQVFNEAKEAGDEVIVLSLSAGLSGTYQLACIAKDMVDYDKITVIDTGSVTLGQRLLIDRAAKMRDAGATCVDIVNMVNEVKDKIVVCGVVNTLEYLKKGGRIPPVLAGIGTALKIKPALMIKDGVIIELAKSRGMKQGIQKVYAEYERMGVNPDWPVYFGYVNDIKPTQDMIDDMAPKYNIEKYTDENLNEYEKYLEDEINKQLKDYNLKVDVKNVKKETMNDLDTISYDVIWPTKESTGYDINQKGYAFTSENYIYVYTFSSDSDLTNNETLKSTINSFKILDKTIEDKSLLNNKLLFSLIVGASIGLVGFIISILIKRR